jgi:hypothetical protein
MRQASDVHASAIRPVGAGAINAVMPAGAERAVASHAPGALRGGTLVIFTRVFVPRDSKMCRRIFPAGAADSRRGSSNCFHKTTKESHSIGEQIGQALFQFARAIDRCSINDLNASERIVRALTPPRRSAPVRLTTGLAKSPQLLGDFAKASKDAAEAA